MKIFAGLDVGSTTAKLIVLDNHKNIIWKDYQRHYSDIQSTVVKMLVNYKLLSTSKESTMMALTISGSSGIGLAEKMQLPFIQEVIACTDVVRLYDNSTDVVIELGGEDAKIIYLTNGVEQRMNSACAGGTGAFIDQIASLIDTDAEGLNNLARAANKIYPVASRCGVFAKSDIQPLLNEGARREDIAASVFQAVVNQTIAGLACGRPIRGKVAFLGGPLTFLDQLRLRFVETLSLTADDILATDNGQYYVAIGAALASFGQPSKSYTEYIDEFSKINNKTVFDNDENDNNKNKSKKKLEPLFGNQQQIDAFYQRHAKAKVEHTQLATYTGNAYLGIDAGSTTTKIILVDKDERVLYSFYHKNKGNPLQSVRNGLIEMYSSLHSDISIAHATVTGYGEKLVQAAFHVDSGEIETVAHYRAARKFCDDVELIIDIGGQDMKCIRIKNKAIDRIMLNEACSAGCGSFLDNFATTLDLDIEQFSDIALQAKSPVDLGSRCTVFMNSKVKEVQKEGASVADISAGLSFSVIANALYKVLRIKRPEELGKKIVVQGGTFLNNAVLRAFEKMIDREVLRPDLAGLMGAYGAALLARDSVSIASHKHKNVYSLHKNKSKVVTERQIKDFEVAVTHARCQLCENRCPLTINKFGNSKPYIIGNRCERGSGSQEAVLSAPNIIAEKNERLFGRLSLQSDKAHRGEIGIPRALNIYENYPLWHKFFTELGFKVVLSNPDKATVYQKGMDTIASESVCFPAKIVHGHIVDLIERGIKKIFYPSVVYEKKENIEQQNHFNCPVVVSYPESVYVNMDELRNSNIVYINPYLTLDNKKALERELFIAFPDIAKQEIVVALRKATQEMDSFRRWLQNRGRDIIEELAMTGQKGVVLAAHPYHLDPAINHGIPGEIVKLGLAVLTEDAVSHMADNVQVTTAVNQWTYHSRLYRAADVVCKHTHLELVQLTSFGCGLDAITSEAIQEILENNGRLFTLIKIDEISNLGAARIRLRSLQAAMNERLKSKKALVEDQVDNPQNAHSAHKNNYAPFNKGDNLKYTILAPQMAPTHFELFKKAFAVNGYNFKILEEVHSAHVEEGLRYVNNDLCYPAIITVGQLIWTLKHGDCDLDRTAVIMSQTGGGCRATNYLMILRKALHDSGLEQVPVLSLNAGSMEKQPGFKLNLDVAHKLVIASCYGDLLMRLLLAVRPYERIRGSTDSMYSICMNKALASMDNFNIKKYKQTIINIVEDFNNIPVSKTKKQKVGIVGEILVKYHPYANNQLIEIIEAEGGEAVVPDFTDFFLYGIHNRNFKAEHLGKSRWHAFMGMISKKYIEYYRDPIREALRETKRFTPPLYIEEIAEKAEKFLSLGNQMGEGWLLTGEIIELIESGANQVVCVQPFACLPNHVIGRGMFKPIKEAYPEANLISIDYDPGSSKVNQLNRIKLMMHSTTQQQYTVTEKIITN